MQETDDLTALQADINRIMDEHTAVLALVRGMDKSGQAQWAYAQVPPSRYEALCRAMQSGEGFKLSDYAIRQENGAYAIAHGQGEAPPPEVTARMAKEYGAAADFERKLQQAMEQSRREMPQTGGPEANKHEKGRSRNSSFSLSS